MFDRLGRGDEAGFESLAIREFLQHRLPFLDDAENALAGDGLGLPAQDLEHLFETPDLPRVSRDGVSKAERSSSDSAASIMAGMALAICCSAK